jgi:hypothetical protein
MASYPQNYSAQHIHLVMVIKTRTTVPVPIWPSGYRVYCLVVMTITKWGITVREFGWGGGHHTMEAYVY